MVEVLSSKSVKNHGLINEYNEKLTSHITAEVSTRVNSTLRLAKGWWWRPQASVLNLLHGMAATRVPLFVLFCLRATVVVIG
jgi:hypothetical protein